MTGSERTQFKPKPIRPLRIEGDVAYVTLTRGYEAIIDAADADLVGQHNWCARVKAGLVYAARSIHLPGDRAVTVLLHRAILGLTGKQHVDHGDGNGLNNRRANLRPCNSSQNAGNQRIARNNTVGLKGVTRNKQGRFQAQIGYLGKRYHLGAFDTPEEAHKAYCDAATRLRGDFARFE